MNKKWHLHKLVVREPSNEVVKELGWFADRRYATEAALGSGLKKEEFRIMNSDKAVRQGLITQDEVDELLLKKAEIGARRLATEMRKGHVTQEEVDKYLIVKGKKNATDSKASEANLNNLNNDAMFAWVRFYESVANKLREFKYRRNELVKGIHKIVEQVDNLSGYDDKFKDGTTGLLKDICPFTSIGLFTRFHSFDDRIIIASKLADFLGVKETAPKTFEGIPVLPMPFVAWFFVYEKDRGDDDIDILWEIFEKAIEFSRNKDARSAFINAYDKAARVKGIKWNLTIGLYWIRPWSFLSLDSSTRDYLEKEFDIKIQNKLPSAKEYLNILETLERIFQKNESPVHSFPELSLAAWESKHQGNGNGNLGENENAMNLILYGPPGTGKTYQLLELAEEYSSNNALLSRKAWLLEELSEATWFETIFGALYDLNGRAKVSKILKHEYVQVKAKSGTGKHTRQIIWGTLMRHAREDSKTVIFKNRGNPPAVFDKEQDSTWRFPNGWEKEYPELLELAENWKAGPKQDSMEKRFEFVTFHQAYSYEDFVEGIRPVPDEETGDVMYEVVPGIFKRICEKAKADPEYWYAIFIDEINRGNIASIFGELITLIETDKRVDYDDDGDLKSGMTLTLPYSREQFGVPANLNIFGAMNTADRSIALLDTALRRRFEFEELMPDTSVIEGSQDDGTIKDGKGGTIDLRALLKAVNRRILFLLNRDMTIGHSYFMKVSDFEDLKEVLLFRIIPLLQEYFYEDWHRIQLVFRDVGPNGEKLKPQIIRHEPLKEEEIIGFDHDDFEDSFEYRVAAEDEITPEAIRKVYEGGKKSSKSGDEEN